MDLQSVILITLGGSGVVGIYFAVYQLVLLKRTYLFTVYSSVMEMIDNPEMRAARHYVYGISPSTYEEEYWLDTEKAPSERRSDYLKNKEKAEKVIRAFGGLSVMARNGQVPIGLIAEYYAYPILKCWDKLYPYIDATRRSSRGGRGQPGHMWVFEYLVFDIVIAGMKKDKGVWKGSMRRDGIDLEFLDELISGRHAMLRDSKLPRMNRTW